MLLVDSKVNVPDVHSCLLDNVNYYRRLARKLIYMIETCPNNSFIVGLLRRFMSELREVHRTNSL